MIYSRGEGLLMFKRILSKALMSIKSIPLKILNTKNGTVINPITMALMETQGKQEALFHFFQSLKYAEGDTSETAIRNQINCTQNIISEYVKKRRTLLRTNMMVTYWENLVRFS